jgi:hypothetical protein
MTSSAVAAFLHGMFPFVLQTTTGDRIRALHALLHARSSSNEDVSQPH